MKKRGWLLVFAAALVALSLGLAACGDDTPTGTEQPPAPVPTVTLSATEGRIDVYETLAITATAQNTDSAIVWSTSDASVAAVEDGLVTGIKEGNATITATAGEASARCAVTVYNSHTAPVLKADYDRVAVNKGGEFTVTLQTLWKGKPLSGVEYLWTLGDGQPDNIVQISASGDKAAFTGKEYGETEYYASAKVHGTELVKKVTVKVCNTDITFEVTNLTPIEHAYSARLALIATDDDVNEITPSVIVRNKGEIVDAQIVWTSNNESVVKVENGKFVAVNEGNAEITGAYENNNIKVLVEAYRPTIRKDGKIVFETEKFLPKENGAIVGEGTASSVTITGEFTGNVTGVRLGDTDICSNFDANTGVLTVNKTNLAKVTAMGDMTLSLDTDKAIYEFDAAVVTKIITTEAEFAKWHEVAKNQTAEEYFYDGYFVLGNDLDFADKDAYEAYWKYTQDTDKFWDKSALCGFRGTFDGDGHTINGLNPLYSKNLPEEGSGSVFGTLSGGTIKDIIFTNYNHRATGGGALIAAGWGNMENIYIECSYLANGKVDISALLVSHNDEGIRVKNCFVQVPATANDQDKTYALGKFTSASVLDNVYCMGDGTGTDLTAQTGAKYGSYATYAEIKAAGIAVNAENGWDMNFWAATADGLPIPKSILKKDYVQITDEETMLGTGTTRQITYIGSRVTFSVDDAATQAGITVSDTGLITVPETAEGVSFTVTVTSLLDENKKDSKSYETVGNKIVNVTDKREIEYKGSGDTFNIDLTSYTSEIEGSLYSVTIGDTAFEDMSYAGNTLTLPRTALKTEFGEKTIVAVFRKTGTNGKVARITTVNIPVLSVTQIIDTEEEFYGWANIAKEVASAKYFYDGYFVLGKDLNFAGKEAYEAYWKWTSEVKDFWLDSEKCGFKGTFDGRGHVINGLNPLYAKNLPEEGSGSVFGVLTATGTIKNMIFTDYNHRATGGGALIVAGKGKMENIFIHCNFLADGAGDMSALLVSHDGDGMTLKNCFVQVPATANDQDKTYALGKFTSASVLDNVYCMGDGTGTDLTAQTGAKYGSYATYAEIKAAGIAVNAENGWDMNFWAAGADGLPIPAKLKTTDAVSVTNTETTMRAGETLQIAYTGIRVAFSVDSAAANKGVTISESGLLSVPATDDSIEVTVTLTSGIDSSKTATETITVIANKIINLTERLDVEYKGNGDNFTIDLSGHSIAGDIKSVTIGNTAFATESFASDTLTLDRATLDRERGEKTITAIFEKTSNGQVVQSTTVNIPVLSVTKVIGSEDEFLNWHKVAKEMATEDWYYDGYFVLGADLDFTDKAMYKAYWTWAIAKSMNMDDRWAYGGAVGFRGTFDGRGHTIKGLTVEGGTGSVFGVLTATGIVRNIIFTDYTAKSGGGAITAGCMGKIENIYIAAKEVEAGDSGNDKTALVCSHQTEWETRIKNVFVRYDKGVANNSNTMLLGQFHMRRNLLNNVYCIGQTGSDTVKGTAAVGIISQDGNADDVWGAFANAEAMKDANVQVSAENGWDMNFWTSDADGLPIPKTLANN